MSPLKFFIIAPLVLGLISCEEWSSKKSSNRPAAESDQSVQQDSDHSEDETTNKKNVSVGATKSPVFVYILSKKPIPGLTKIAVLKEDYYWDASSPLANDDFNSLMLNKNERGDNFIMLNPTGRAAYKIKRYLDIDRVKVLLIVGDKILSISDVVKEDSLKFYVGNKNKTFSVAEAISGKKLERGN